MDPRGVAVQHLELLGVEARLLQEVGGAHAGVERVSRDQVAQTQLDERAQIPGRAMGEFHDATRLPVDEDDVSAADVGGFHAGGKIIARHPESTGPHDRTAA